MDAIQSDLLVSQARIHELEYELEETKSNNNNNTRLVSKQNHFPDEKSL